jgi:uncharacterized protein YhfF
MPIPQAWGFGDNARLADELGNLVLSGLKTATASLPWEYEVENEAIPCPGDLSIILDGAGYPICLIETTSVVVLPFDQVDASHAYDEGEDDRSLDSWREGHWRYFTRVCAAIGFTPAENMPVVCERFRLVFPAPAGV